MKFIEFLTIFLVFINKYLIWMNNIKGTWCVGSKSKKIIYQLMTIIIENVRESLISWRNFFGEILDCWISQNNSLLHKQSDQNLKQNKSDVRHSVLIDNCWKWKLERLPKWTVDCVPLVIMDVTFSVEQNTHFWMWQIVKKFSEIYVFAQLYWYHNSLSCPGEFLW